ncbi:unnamed protein product [Paramecium primaurelia]|uniref:Uncharacterized protein n=1 Tax=Paramecium primaurelia TaxID=5886 RepID=A0A8S1KCB3_PARPR|nr:unnamed protein product [Paramecium primaurelia]
MYQIEVGNINKDFEVGNMNKEEINQILAKYAFKCEICFIEEPEQQKETEQQKKNEQQQKKNEVRLVAAKVTSQQPIRKSYIVVCPDHFLNIEGALEKFLSISKIKYSVQQIDIKKAKLVTIPDINLRDAIQSIQYNYCCRILKLRLSKTDTQIQMLNCDNLEQTIENAFEQKKKELETTQEKFKYYVENQDKMSMRQKFLIYHYYLRLQRKSKLQQDDLILKNDQEVGGLSMSISIPFADLEPK